MSDRNKISDQNAPIQYNPKTDSCKVLSLLLSVFIPVMLPVTVHSNTLRGTVSVNSSFPLKGIYGIHIKLYIEGGKLLLLRKHCFQPSLPFCQIIHFRAFQIQHLAIDVLQLRQTCV